MNLKADSLSKCIIQICMINFLYFSERTFIYNAPEDQVAIANTDVVFECQAFTDPREVAHLTIRWKRNGQLINFENESRFLYSDADNTLTIIQCEVNDSGNYTCVADNGLDSYKATAMLIVNSKGMHALQL